MTDYSYAEAVSYIEETPKFTKKNSLAHTRECLRRLGDPQKCFRVIHVAGTNGKGSTCAFLESILRAAGYRCGLFTSPHLLRINERFKVDGKDVDDASFLTAFLTVREMIRDLEAENISHPTYFEMLFLMGMLLFAGAGVEIVVLETGLGGRLDATTSIEDPLACVITSISRDHMQYLGNTVEEIAGEKAGILIPGVPVIYDASDPVAASVIARKAAGLECPGIPLYPRMVEIIRRDAGSIDFSLKNGYYDRKEPFHISFVADYQTRNAALAVLTVQTLGRLEGDIKTCRMPDHPSWKSRKADENEAGPHRLVLPLRVGEDALRRGLAAARWPGRMERVAPGIYVDGAHNEDGIARFVETAAVICNGTLPVLLFSAVSDKDWEEMVRTICRSLRPSRVFVTEVGGQRAVSCRELKAAFLDNGCACVTAIPSSREACGEAIRSHDPGEILFCAGSLYLTGDMIRFLQEASGPADDKDL